MTSFVCSRMDSEKATTALTRYCSEHGEAEFVEEEEEELASGGEEEEEELVGGFDEEEEEFASGIEEEEFN